MLRPGPVGAGPGHATDLIDRANEAHQVLTTTGLSIACPLTRCRFSGMSHPSIDFFMVQFKERFVKSLAVFFHAFPLLTLFQPFLPLPLGGPLIFGAGRGWLLGPSGPRRIVRPGQWAAHTQASAERKHLQG